VVVEEETKDEANESQILAWSASCFADYDMETKTKAKAKTSVTEDCQIRLKF